MKMLGFVIVMTLAYWGVASYAQSLLLASEPCSGAAEVASLNGAGTDLAGAEASGDAASTALKLRGRWSGDDAYQVIEAASAPACAG